MQPFCTQMIKNCYMEVLHNWSSAVSQKCIQVDEKKEWKKVRIQVEMVVWVGKKPEWKHSEQSEQEIDNGMQGTSGCSGGSQVDPGKTHRERKETVLRSSAQPPPPHHLSARLVDQDIKLAPVHTQVFLLYWLDLSLALVLAFISSFVVSWISSIPSWIDQWVYLFYRQRCELPHSEYFVSGFASCPLSNDPRYLSSPSREYYPYKFHFLYNM